MRYILIMVIALLWGCTPNDSDIRKAIAVSAKDELMFAGISYTVDHGAVTLNGNCASEELRNKLIASVKSSPGVKSVNDYLVIAPVVLDSDFILKEKVDSAIAGYAAVRSQVSNGLVRLSGEVGRADTGKLLTSVRQLSPDGLQNNLAVKEK